MIHNHTDHHYDHQVSFTANRTSEGTVPKGSEWSKNPIPNCAGLGGGQKSHHIIMTMSPSHHSHHCHHDDQHDAQVNGSRRLMLSTCYNCVVIVIIIIITIIIVIMTSTIQLHGSRCLVPTVIMINIIIMIIIVIIIIMINTMHRYMDPDASCPGGLQFPAPAPGLFGQGANIHPGVN